VPSNLVNGDPGGTGWHTNGGPPQWCQFDLGAGNEKIVRRMRIVSRPFGAQSPRDFRLSGSNSPTGPWSAVGIYNEPVDWAGQTKDYRPVPGFVTPPQITGSHGVGDTLTVSYTFTIGTLARQVWRRNGVVIPGETGLTYVRQAADEGTLISCDVTLNGTIVRTAKRYIGPVGVTATRWRLRAFNTSYLVVTEVEMCAYPGSPDQCNGGTAVASSQLGGNPPATAFDNNSTTVFHSGNQDNAWLEYQFPTAVAVNEVRLQARIDDNQTWSPGGLALEYWNGSAWVIKSLFFQQSAWVRSTWYTYDFRSEDQRLLGPERIVDFSFNDPTKWLASGGWSVSGGNGIGSGAANELRQNNVFEIGKSYRFVMPYSGRSGGNLRIKHDTNASNWAFFTSGQMSTEGTLYFSLVGATGSHICLQADGSTINITIPWMSVREDLEA
jgi:hypothetical protein